MTKKISFLLLLLSLLVVLSSISGCYLSSEQRKNVIGYNIDDSFDDMKTAENGLNNSNSTIIDEDPEINVIKADYDPNEDYGEINETNTTVENAS
jgi:hypothetical protein